MQNVLTEDLHSSDQIIPTLKIASKYKLRLISKLNIKIKIEGKIKCFSVPSPECIRRSREVKELSN